MPSTNRADPLSTFGSAAQPQCPRSIRLGLLANPLFKSGQIQLLGIDVEETSKDAANNFIKNTGMSWPHLIDEADQTKSIFGPGVPVTWFIDETGKVVEQKIGAYQSKDDLYAQVEKAFGVKL